MKSPSVQSFVQSLLLPVDSFATLEKFEVECSEGLPVVNRTSLFAEVRITMQGERYLLCLPVRSESVRRVEESIFVLRRICGGALTECRILEGEYRFMDERGSRCRCDLLLHRLPEGETLEEAVTHIDRRILLGALERLRGEFVQHGVRHRNLKPSNIIFGEDGRLSVMRCYYMVAESDREAIDAEFAAVEEYVAARAGECDRQRSERCEERLHGFDEVGVCYDMMRRVCRDGMYGYADDEGCVVIEPQFAYAGHFRENRVVVERFDGRQGVIDRTGRYIVEPLYDMIDLTEEGNFEVRHGDRMEIFDYFGRPITN